jgi:transforming growth factor-beta-induced protein
MNKTLIALPVVLLAACSSPRKQDIDSTAVGVQAAPGLATMIGGEGRAERSFGTFGSAVLSSGIFDGADPWDEYTLIAVRDRDLAGFGRELQAYGPSELRTILEFHVLPGRIGSQMLSSDTSFETLSGQRLFVSNWGGEVEVYARGANGERASSATVLETDIEFEHGLLHFVDRPLVPATEDLRTTLERLGDFDILLSIVDRSGAGQLLDSDGPFTLLAPTDRAFEAVYGVDIDLDSEVVGDVLDDAIEPRLLIDELLESLGRHMFAGRVFARDFATGTMNSLDGSSVEVRFGKQGFRFGEARVLRSDLETRNGVIHVVDGLIEG